MKKKPPKREQHMGCALETPVTLKVVLVGDFGSGKTSLINAFSEQSPANDVPRPNEELEVVTVRVDDKTVSLKLWDTMAHEDYDRLRPLTYPDTDVMVLCFSVVDRDSYANIAEKWAPEVTHHCFNVPIVLVGTKIDLRHADDVTGGLVSTAEGTKLEAAIRAKAYVECSATSGQGVSNVMQKVAHAWMTQKKRCKCNHSKRLLGCQVL